MFPFFYQAEGSAADLVVGSLDMIETDAVQRCGRVENIPCP